MLTILQFKEGFYRRLLGYAHILKAQEKIRIEDQKTRGDGVQNVDPSSFNSVHSSMIAAFEDDDSRLVYEVVYEQTEATVLHTLVPDPVIRFLGIDQPSRPNYEVSIQEIPALEGLVYVAIKLEGLLLSSMRNRYIDAFSPNSEISALSRLKALVQGIGLAATAVIMGAPTLVYIGLLAVKLPLQTFISYIDMNKNSSVQVRDEELPGSHSSNLVDDADFYMEQAENEINQFEARRPVDDQVLFSEGGNEAPPLTGGSQNSGEGGP